MYKLLLCVRYLQTRYLAFICIVSVMLGVATLIVVNAVMSGFSTKLKDRLHGVLSDVVIDTDRMDGFVTSTRTSDGRPARRPTRSSRRSRPARPATGSRPSRPTIEVFAILQFQLPRAASSPSRSGSSASTRQGRAAVGGFSEYLVRQKDARTRASTSRPEALQRHEWNKRQRERPTARTCPSPQPAQPLVAGPERDPRAGRWTSMQAACRSRSCTGSSPATRIAHFRFRDEHGQVVEEAALKPGDDVTITTVGGGDAEAGVGQLPGRRLPARPR